MDSRSNIDFLSSLLLCEQGALLRQRRVGFPDRSQRRVDESGAELVGRHAVQESHVVLSRGERDAFLKHPRASKLTFPRKPLNRLHLLYRTI
jgi:hypothetical protein